MTDPYLAASWRDWSCSVRVVVDGSSKADLAVAEVAVRAVMDEVGRSADRFVEDSDVSVVNAAPGRMIPVSALTISLLDTAVQVARDTGDVVTPMLGHQLQAAGYIQDIDIVKSRLGQAERPGPAASVSRVSIERALGCVSVPKGVEIDLGATAKAWAVDAAAERARRACGRSVVVSIGGDLAARGDRIWNVAVQETEIAQTDQAPTEEVLLHHGALATSTTLARRWRTNAGLSHHILDPSTGAAADGPWRTATVWAPSAVAANALSTAAIVWGQSALGELENRRAAARLVDRTGSVTYTDRWPTKVSS